jgi:hypothetical protein
LDRNNLGAYAADTPLRVMWKASMLPPSGAHRSRAAGVKGEKRSMKDLIKQYLEHGISRRSLMRGLGAAGLSGGVAKSLIDSLTISPAMAQEAAATGAIRQVHGNGGTLYMQQLKAAGVKYVFFNPSTGDAPFYDALVDIPEIQLIKGIQEGAVVAMADG